jgi:hypothetical protein
MAEKSAFAMTGNSCMPASTNASSSVREVDISVAE